MAEIREINVTLPSPTLDADLSLEERLQALEKDVADLKSAREDDAPGRNAWLNTLGRFKDDPLFDEALRLGRAYRKRQPKC